MKSKFRLYNIKFKYEDSLTIEKLKKKTEVYTGQLNIHKKRGKYK